MSARADDRRIANLAAFARLSGYVRFFHPSDESAAADWAALAIHGAGRAKHAANAAALAAALREAFLPLAPTVEIAAGPLPPRRSAGRGPVVFWQHYGVRSSERENIYRSVRIGRPGDPAPLFPARPEPGEVTEVDLGGGVSARVPLTLPFDDRGTCPRAEAGASERLARRLAEIDPSTADYRDEDVRFAAVALTWNVLQHFWPGFDEIRIDWDAALATALADAAGVDGPGAFADVLRRMIAKLEDGHGVVWWTAGGKLRPSPPGEDPGRVPARFEWVEERVAVSAVAEEIGLAPGDGIVAIDGAPAAAALARIEETVSGSPWLRRHRALNLLGSGPADGETELVRERDGALATLRVRRTLRRFDLFWNAVRPWDYDGIREIAPGVWHLNLARLTRSEFAAREAALLRAKGVLVDFRWGGGGDFPHHELLPRLLDREVRSPRWHVPRVIRPDRRGMEFDSEDWTMAPVAPRLGGRYAFLVGPAVVSAGETTLGIVEHYRLGAIVGERTGGCNGVVNFVDLPGGLALMWTGMKVRKRDGSRHPLVGIEPTHPVRQTLAALREGRDEVLERGVEVVTA